jgi:hypothetical protein
MQTQTTGRTRRSPDGAYAGTGAVRQHDGTLPIYICNTCGREVVWATSAKTGRKYLANIARGHLDQRFYIAASLHDCGPELRRREEAARQRESNAHYAYLFMLLDEHDEQGHPTPEPMCRRCERGQTLTDVAHEALDPK